MVVALYSSSIQAFVYSLSHQLSISMLNQIRPIIEPSLSMSHRNTRQCFLVAKRGVQSSLLRLPKVRVESDSWQRQHSSDAWHSSAALQRPSIPTSTLRELNASSRPFSGNGELGASYREALIASRHESGWRTLPPLFLRMLCSCGWYASSILFFTCTINRLCHIEGCVAW